MGRTEEGQVTFHRYGVSFGGDKNVLEVDGDDGCITL